MISSSPPSKSLAAEGEKRRERSERREGRSEGWREAGGGDAEVGTRRGRSSKGPGALPLRRGVSREREGEGQDAREMLLREHAGVHQDETDVRDEQRFDLV